MTTQEYRRANYRFVSNPVYDKGVWKNIKNELFTYHPGVFVSYAFGLGGPGNGIQS